MIRGREDCLPGSERATANPRAAQVVAIVPVLAGSTLWGHIGFYQYHGTVWSEVELEAVKAAARILGAAIRRSEVEETLRATHEDLENRVRERTKTLLQEIDERRSVAETLKQTEKRFRAVFDEAPIGMNLLDPDGRIVESNVALQQMLGYTRDQLHGKAFAELSHADDYEMDFQCFGELIQGKRDRYSMEKRYQQSDGSVLWTRLTVSLLKSAGDEGFAIAMIEDINGQKQLEEQFRQAQKMEAIGQLAGGVAHDFNNLLTVIKGYSELLAKHIEEDSPLRRKLGQIRKASDRAATLVSQLLAFSRKQVNQPRVLDLNNLIRDVEKMLRRLIGEDIQFVTILNPAGYVKADPGQLEQVLMNLTVNARDAMPEGGRMIIQTSSADLADASHDGLPPGKYTVLEFADTGTGMSAEVRSHIFEPFFTTKAVGKGTGLGLSTVYGIVKQAGGAIFVQSELGQGSLFEIYLPAVEAAPLPATDPVPQDAAAHGDETILVVEDERLVQAMIIETLSDCGFRVLAARDGTEACRVAASCDALRLLITDVVLPGMSGVEVARQVLLKQPAARVLYISGYSDHQFAAATFLKKPFGPEDLARKVRVVLDFAPVPQAEGSERESAISGQPAV
jgi:PAS domain S-box-containing protein